MLHPSSTSHLLSQLAVRLEVSRSCAEAMPISNPPFFTLGEQRLAPHSRSESRGVQWGAMQRAQTWSWFGLQSVDTAEEEHFQEKTACCSQAFCILSPFCAGEGAATHTEVLSAGPRLGACSQLHRMSAQQVCGMSLLNSPEQLSLFFPGEGVGVGLFSLDGYVVLLFLLTGGKTEAWGLWE